MRAYLAEQRDQKQKVAALARASRSRRGNRPRLAATWRGARQSGSAAESEAVVARECGDTPVEIPGRLGHSPAGWGVRRTRALWRCETKTVHEKHKLTLSGTKRRTCLFRM